MTPCEIFIRSLLAKNNFLSTEEFMNIALSHPTFGYYRTNLAIGRQADFITAPEVSQMYGELIGLWCIDLWQQLGCPSPFQLIELGPGRGTLMADIIRISHNTPGFLDACHIHLVEINSSLIQTQQQTLRHPHMSWHTCWSDIPLDNTPFIVIANEYFDALPVQQFIYDNNELYERGICLKNDQLVWTKKKTLKNIYSPPRQNLDFYEVSSTSENLIDNISQALKINKGAILIVDYGYDIGFGNSLQGIYQHRYCNPLENIGNTDLSCHVNFNHLKKMAIKNDIQTTDILSQGQFLHNLGIILRLESLQKNASLKEKAILRASYERLTHPAQMGMLFKAMSAFTPSLLRPAGF